MRLYRARLRAHVRRRHGDRVIDDKQPSDLVQEAASRIIEKFRDFKGTTEPEWHAWCLTILDNAFTSARRGAHRQKRDARKQVPLSRVEAWDLRASLASPSEAVLTRQRWRRVLAEMTTLPELQRQALRLHYLKGQSVRQIAQSLGCSSEVSAAGYLQRGLSALKERLDESRPPHRRSGDSDEPQATLLAVALCEYLDLRERGQPTDETAFLSRHVGCGRALAELRQWMEELGAQLQDLPVRRR